MYILWLNYAQFFMFRSSYIKHFLYFNKQPPWVAKYIEYKARRRPSNAIELN